MPTLISHGFVGILFGKTIVPTDRWKVAALAAACAIIPDADVVLFRFGVPYSNMFGHRGFSHSLLFALFPGFLAGTIVFRLAKPATGSRWKFVLFFFVVAILHSILDAFTSGGLGVAFFAPFSAHRCFFPFRPIRVSPFSIEQLLGPGGIAVMRSELLWVWLPASAVAFTVSLARRRRLRSPKTS